jgi:hypothetical protein
MAEIGENDGQYWPHNPLRKRAETDPSFRQLVRMFEACLEQGQYTPTEIREAAMLAQILYEERHPRPVTFSRDDVIRGKV